MQGIDIFFVIAGILTVIFWYFSRSFFKKLNALEWPIVGVNDIKSSVDFYTKQLGFELLNDSIELDECKEVQLNFLSYSIILRRGGNGPIYENSKKVIKEVHNFKRVKNEGKPTLNIEIPDPDEWLKKFREKGVKCFEEDRKYIGEETKGFYILDNEDNKFHFYKNYHNPDVLMGPYGWYWAWNWHIK